MSDFTTHYVFRIDVEGAQAVQQAKQVRDQITTALSKATGGTSAAVGGSVLDRLAKDLQAVEIQYFGLRRLSYGLQSTGRDFTRFGQQIINVSKQAAESYLDFADSLTRASMAMELPVEMQDELAESVRETSNVLGAFDAQQLMDTMRTWVAGTGQVVTSQKDINQVMAVTTQIMRLAAMNNVDVEKTVENVGAAMSQFGLGQKDVTAIIEDFNFVAAKTFANVTDLGTALTFVGPGAAQVGDTFQEVTTVLGALADAGLKGSKSGRALRQVYRGLIKPTDDAAEALNKLFKAQLKVGETWEDVVKPGGEFVGIIEYVTLLADATEGLTQSERANAMAKITVANASTSLIQLTQDEIAFREKAAELGFENVSKLRAQYKEKMGMWDDEVMAYELITEALTGMNYKLQEATTLLRDMITTWLGSDPAEAANLMNRWANAVSKMGKILFEEGIPYLETFVGLFEKLADLVEAYPEIPDLALKAGITSYAIGKVTEFAGKIAGLVANLLIIKKLAPGLLGSLGMPALTAATGPAYAGALMLSTHQLRPEMQAMSDEELRRIIATAYSPGIGGMGMAGTSPALIAALEEAGRRVTARELGYGVAGGMIGPAAGYGVAGGMIGPYEEAYAPHVGRFGPGVPEEPRTPAQLDIAGWMDTYGSWVDAAEKFEEQILDKQKSFDAATIQLEKEHLDDLDQLSRDRADGRADILDRYGDQVEDTWRSHNRSIEQAEKSHNQTMLDIVEDGTEQRADLVARQAGRLADVESSYRLSLADTAEAFQYSEGLAEENYLERRQALITEYNEWELEQVDKQSDEWLKEEEERNQKLLDLRLDYEKSMSRHQEDHIDSMWDLVRAHDVRGALDQIRDNDKWKRRRTEDYQDDKAKLLKIDEASLAAEKEQRKRNLEEELADLDAAEVKRKEKAQKAYERRLWLMKRAHDRRLVELKEQNKDELKSLEDSIKDRQDAENESYKRRLTAMKEAHGYRLSEMEREQADLIKAYDSDTYWLKVKIQEQYDEKMETRKDKHAEEMDLLYDYAKEELQAQYDALSLDPAELEKIFMERWAHYANFFGIEIDKIRQYLGQKMAGVSEEFWSDVGTAAAQATQAGRTGGYTGSGIAGAPYAPTTPKPTTTPSARGIAGAPYTPLTGGVPYEEMFRAAGKKYGVDWRLLAAQAGWESLYTYDPTIREGATARGGVVTKQGTGPGIGIGQFMPGTWESYKNELYPNAPRTDVEATIYGMAAYMADAQRYLGTKDPQWLSLAYNMGFGGAAALSSKGAAPRAQQDMIKAVGEFKMGGPLFTSAATTAAVGRGKTYTVKQGDTLSQIASRYGVPWRELASYNAITNPDLIFPGQVLNIPMGLAGGGLVTRPGIYSLAEKGPEMVLNAETTKALMGGARSMVLNQNYVFHGKFTEGERQWFRRTARDQAYEAFAEVASG